MSVPMTRHLQKVLVYSQMARDLGSLSTCPRGEVGCIITDGSGFVLSTGYNGLPSGQPLCTSPTEPGACKAVHAEQNALMQCRNINEASVLYVSLSPCKHCVKMLANTNIHCIWFSKEYRDTDPLDWWLSIGREASFVDLSAATVTTYK